MYKLITSLTTLLPLAAAAPFQAIVARDDNEGCQAKSLSDFSWEIEGFDYHASYLFTTPAHQNSWGYVSFNLTNPALEYHAQCSRQSNQLSEFFYGTQNYDCILPDGSSTAASFNYSTPEQRLNINQTWTCSDEDPNYPVTFSAYGTIQLDLKCTDETTTNPGWEFGTGEFYSERYVTCEPATKQLKPYQKTAIA